MNKVNKDTLHMSVVHSVVCGYWRIQDCLLFDAVAITNREGSFWSAPQQSYTVVPGVLVLTDLGVARCLQGNPFLALCRCYHLKSHMQKPSHV